MWLIQVATTLQVQYLSSDTQWKIPENCIVLSNGKIMHLDRLWYYYWYRVMHETILGNYSVSDIWWWIWTAKCKHLAYMEGFCKLKGLFHHNELLSFFYKDVFTSEWVNFWMSSKGMRQSRHNPACQELEDLHPPKLLRTSKYCCENILSSMFEARNYLKEFIYDNQIGITL